MDPAARVVELERAVRELSEALRESTRLLNKCRPARPPIPHERKLLVAARQKWRCANPTGACLLYKLGDGCFDEFGLFEVSYDCKSQGYRNTTYHFW